jgi:hypothetical protein
MGKLESPDCGVTFNVSAASVRLQVTFLSLIQCTSHLILLHLQNQCINVINVTIKVGVGREEGWKLFYPRLCHHFYSGTFCCYCGILLSLPEYHVPIEKAITVIYTSSSTDNKDLMKSIIITIYNIFCR